MLIEKQKYKWVVLFLLGIFFFGCGSDDNTTSDDQDTTTDTCGAYTETTTTETGKYKIVDTNQSECYNSSTGAAESCIGTGYDGDYNTINQPSYTNNGNGTVTDNVTGLMWTQTPDLDGDGNVDSSDKKSQCEAYQYCENLSLGGYDDWRLPNVKTLYSLMDFTGTDPTGYEGTDTSLLDVFIPSVFEKAFGDQDAGERIIDGQYATTSIYVYYTNLGTGNAETMFGVNFVDGRIKGYPTENKTYYIHCVRENIDYGLNNFSDNGDETISDAATGLMWQKSDAQSTDFENAVSICENATTATHTDWRLPNIKELQSILDYSRSPDTTSSSAINSIFNSTSFTNEGGNTDWGYYWSSTTHATYDSDSTDNDGLSGAYVSFGRALGYISGVVYDVHGAGAQRSNYKQDVSVTSGAENAGSFYYHGPQGDILRENNMVRCVRNE